MFKLFVFLALVAIAIATPRAVPQYVSGIYGTGLGYTGLGYGSAYGYAAAPYAGYGGYGAYGAYY